MDNLERDGNDLTVLIHNAKVKQHGEPLVAGRVAFRQLPSKLLGVEAGIGDVERVLSTVLQIIQPHAGQTVSAERALLVARVWLSEPRVRRALDAGRMSAYTRCPVHRDSFVTALPFPLILPTHAEA